MACPSATSDETTPAPLTVHGLVTGVITVVATSLVPRVDGETSYYPAISDDDNFVVFDQSSCSGPANSPRICSPKVTRA